jgi:serine/threonine protein phosphatase PrpC
MSEDHKPMNSLEKLRIIKAGGFVYANRVDGQLAMSRALGDFSFKCNHDLSQDHQKVICKPELRVHERSDQDRFIVLACDGVFDVLSNEKTTQLVDTWYNEAINKSSNDRSSSSSSSSSSDQHKRKKSKLDNGYATANPKTDNDTCTTVDTTKSDNHGDDISDSDSDSGSGSGSGGDCANQDHCHIKRLLPESLARKLVLSAFDGGSFDNISTIVCLLNTKE